MQTIYRFNIVYIVEVKSTGGLLQLVEIVKSLAASLSLASEETKIVDLAKS